MTWLPVVEREIRVAARQRATYRIRFWAVLIMLGLFAFVMLDESNRSGNSSQAGRQLLEPLTLLSFLLAISIGAIATSDSVSEEKREGTLGLLFLTDLKGYDVILGKLVAHSINGFYALVAIMPILGMPLLMGGVTLLQFVKLIIALVSTIVFSLAAGIFVSTRSRNERRAMVFTFLLLAAVTFVPFLLAFWLTQDSQRISERQIWRFFMFSPGFAVSMALGSPSEWPVAAYWYGVGISWAGAILLLFDAAKTAPRSWAERAPKPVRSRAADGGGSVPRTKTSRWMLDDNPFLWLAMRGEASRARVWFFVLAIFAIWLLAWTQCGSIIWSFNVVLPTAFILGVGLKIWVVGEASRRFVEDRRNNAMEFLLSTPLNERQIIRGQWQALLWQFLWPVVAVLLWETVMAFVMNNHMHWWDNHPELKLPQLLCAMFFLPADMVALGWAGMMLGMTSKGRGRAMLTGLALIVVLPLVLTQIFMALLEHFGGAFPRGQRDDLELVRIFIFICASLMIDLAVICLARFRLLSNFRDLALSVVSR
jgi:ABC-type transport system involved in cytochrome c biogenesis permease component